MNDSDNVLFLKNISKMLPNNNNYSTLESKKHCKNKKYVEDEGPIYTYGG